MEETVKSTLVFGKDGQVANALQQLWGDRASFLGRADADFLKPESVIQALEERKPRTIVIASAYTAVDKAETERNAALQLNATTPGLVASWAANHGARVIHYSSDYVYPGTGADARSEDAATGPLNYYGETKLLGDRALIESGAEAWILRTSWVYSHMGANFVKTMLRLGSEREELSVVADQVGAPTYAPAIADATDRLLKSIEAASKTPGIYHLCASGTCSWHEFAEEIFAQARALGIPLKVSRVKPITTAEYPTPARRPLNSRLSAEKLARDFGIRLPTWKESLNVCLRRLHGNPPL